MRSVSFAQLELPPSVPFKSRAFEMSRARFVAFGLLVLLPALNVQAQMKPNTQRGATLGGIAGAIAGGIIGDNNDEAGAGALIGGAVGALAGGALGNARDKELEYQQQVRQYEAQQRLYAAQQQQYQVRQGAVSINDVVTMVRSGLSDTIVINQVMERGVQRRLEVSDIIQLHQNGVSEGVITAMQRATVGTPVPPSVSVSPQSPVVIERHVEVVPTYVVPAPRYYRYPSHYHQPRRGSSWGFSYGF